MTDSVDLLEQKLASYAERGVTRVKLALTDLDGVLRGKYVSLDKFASLLAKGGGFCDCVFGWDVEDQLYDAGVYTGWHTGFPDADYRVLVDSERWLADENTPLFLGQFVGALGAPHPICPYTRLQQMLDRLASHGLSLKSGFEYEFFVFDETPHSVRDKGYRELRPLTPGNFGYSVLRASAHGAEFAGLMDYCRELHCDLEGLHCETGPGVWEGALRPELGMEAADRAALFKTFAKVFFSRMDCMATFMAKWSMDYPGQSGHFHFSLLDESGTNAFGNADNDGNSPLMAQAVAGLERFLPDLLPMVAPTINSYTRLVKGAWAPTAATWGVENRTAAIRVIPGDTARQHIECRVPGADGNPYLVAAAVIAAALGGIEQGLTPGEAVVGDAYAVEDKLPSSLRFSSNLRDAADRMERSELARDMFGEEFVDHFVMSRRWECAEYERHVNAWQLERYFEII